MRQNRTNLALGLILILVGAWLVIARQVPGVQDWIDQYFVWPMWTIGAGLLVFLVAIATQTPSLAVPAAMIAGIGGILYYQNANDDFGSWAYLWTLIPGFIGVGAILAGLLGEDRRRNLSRGTRLLIISVILFVIFASFLGGPEVFGELGLPILLIVVGLILILRGAARHRPVIITPQPPTRTEQRDETL